MSCILEQSQASTNFSWILEVSVTFLAFFLGLISTLLLNRWNDKNKRKRLKKFYLSWIGFSLESFERQILLLKKHVENIENNEFSKLEFNNNQINKLSDINNEELFDAFVISNKGDSNLNSKNLHKLGGHIEFLNLAITDIKEKFYDYKNDLKKWNDDWNMTFLEFGNTIESYILNHRKNMGKNAQEISELTRYLRQFNQSNPPSTKQLMDNFVTPSRLIFNDHLNLSNDSIAKKGKEVSDSLYSLSIQKSDQTQKYIKNISGYCNQFEYTISKIKEIVDYFNNQK